MNDQSKTREELVRELQEIRQENVSLKTAYEKDIIEHKKAGKALQAISSRQDALLMATPDIIAEVDNNKLFTWTNTAGYEFYGEDVIGKEAAFYFVGEQNTYDIINPLFDGKEDIYRVESWQRRRDGQHRLLSWWCKVLKDDRGNVTGALSSALDITESKETEKELIKAKEKAEDSEKLKSLTLEKLNEAQAISKIGSWDWNIITGEVWWSNELYKIFEVNPDNYIPSVESNASFVHPDDNDAYHKAVFKCLETGEELDYIIRIISSSGKLKHCRSKARILFDNNQKAARMTGTFSDITVQVQLHTELQTAKEKYQVLAENISDVIFELDIDNHEFTYVSPSVFELIGYTPEEIMTKGFGVAIATEFAQIINQEIQSALEEFKIMHDTSTKYRAEAQLVHKNGKRFYAETILTFHTGNDGVNKAIGVTRNIDQRKKEEEILKKSQVLLQSSIESQKDTFFFSIDLNYQYLFFNKVHSDLMKLVYDKEIIQGMNFLECINSEHERETAKRDYDRVFQEGAFSTVRKRVFGDVEPVYYEGFFNPIFNDKNEVIGATTLGRDITERKKAEATLHDSEANLNAIFNTTDESIFLLNADETLIRLNKIAAERLGCSCEEIFGFKLSDLLPSDVESGRRPFINHSLKTGEKVSFENEWNGRWMINKLCPILNEEGKVVRLAIYSRDITVRKQAEEEIKRQNNELHQINAEKDKFFSIIAHDLRSPFSAFLGFTQMMVEELDNMTLKDIQKIAVSMRKSATNLFKLLENLLEWSRLQRGVITFDPVLFLLKDKILENLSMVLESVNKKEIRFDYNVPEDLKVYADENMFWGIIRNLSSNAVKFTPKSGKVTVAAKSLDNNWVEISVEDTGIGMNQEMVKNLFKLDMDTSRKGTENESSTGLGLIICKEFIEKHGGKLWVESKENKGSTFYFTLPAHI